MGKIKLIATDLDGTLLGEDNKMSSENKAALEQAIAEGVEIVIATGRNYSEVPEDVLSLGVRFFITANGGYVYDKKEDKVLYTKCLTLEQAQYLINLARINHGYEMYYIGRKVYTCSNFMDYIDHVQGADVYRHLYKKYNLCDDISKEEGADKYTPKVVIFFETAEDKAKMLSMLDRREEFEQSTSFKENVELNPKGVSKAEGLKVIMEVLGLNPEEVAAFGDGGNDYKMLCLTPNSFAVEGAVPEVKECAKYHVAACEKNGVSEAVEICLGL